MSEAQLRRQQRELRQFQRRSGQFVASDETATLCFLLRYRRHSDSDRQQLAETAVAAAAAAATATVASTTGAGATSATVKLRRLVQRQQRPQSTAFEMSNV